MVEIILRMKFALLIGRKSEAVNGFSTFGIGVTEIFFSCLGNLPVLNEQFIILLIGSAIKSAINLKHFGGNSSGPVALLLILKMVLRTSSGDTDLKLNSDGDIFNGILNAGNGSSLVKCLLRESRVISFLIAELNDSLLRDFAVIPNLCMMFHFSCKLFVSL